MEKKHRVLIVDDTEMNRALLADMLSADYEILEASNGMEAVELLNRFHTELSLVLLDIVMPQMDGFEVLSIMNRSGWIHSVPVITISSETASSYIDHAYDLGATDYINRPFDEKTVQRRVKNTIMLYTKQKMLEGMVTEQILEKEKNNFLMVEILSNIVEFRNGESGLHVLHIRVITEILLKKLAEMTDRYHLSPSRIALIVNASALHDIGKISIPEQILNKPGRLTGEEFEIMKTHSAIGARILENAPSRQEEALIQVAHDICRWHHERYDGRGYPDGLSEEAIPIAAQVVAMADVYDALTSERVYKPAFPHAKAMEMILGGECGAFSPLLLECLIRAGEHIAREVRVRSLGGVSDAEVRSIASELISGGKLHTSSRTLLQLEQERIKSRFYSSLCQEVQFEYNARSDLLELSEWGAEHLGLRQLIASPAKNGELAKVFPRESLEKFLDQLNAATPERPLFSGSYRLTALGRERWFKVVARTLWDGEDAARCSGFIGKLIDIHGEQMELAAFQRLAAQDPLTSLLNRRAAREAVEAAITGAQDRTFALLLLDVDRFKRANDRYGHVFGDEVLRHVAQRLRQNIRQTDVAARVGGDEFLIFAAYKGAAEPQIRRLFQSLQDEYQGFCISICIGAALFPLHGTDYEALFRCADQALCAAKRDGQDRYRLYDDSVREARSALSPLDG